MNSHSVSTDSCVTKSNVFSTLKPMLKKAYCDLIKTVSDDDIVIFAESEGPCSSLTRGENGAFETSWQGNGPRILIANKTRVNFQPKLGKLGIQKFDEFVETLVNDAAHDLTSAVYTLAHEYGHFKSYQGGTRGADYETALNIFNEDKIDDLTDKQKNLILNEEELAWRNGKKVLDGLYAVDEGSFQARQNQAMQVYRQILKMI